MASHSRRFSLVTLLPIAGLAVLLLCAAACESSGGGGGLLPDPGGAGVVDTGSGQATDPGPGTTTDAPADEGGTSEPKEDAAVDSGAGEPAADEGAADEGAGAPVTGCDPEPEAGSLWALSAPDREGGEETRMCSYRGKTLIIVNIAANCGFTTQLRGLAEMQTEFAGQGLQMLGFYCDQFMNQAGTLEEQKLIEENLGVNFPVYGLVDVNGASEHPVFTWLKSQPEGAGEVTWNFTKWMVSPEGAVLKRWIPQDSPTAMRPYVEGVFQ